ncbi:MAG: zinc metallopeptidase [Lachnospirales bacterium]
MFYWGDWTFLILIPSMILSMYAQGKVTSTYQKFSSVRNRQGLTGADVARIILQRNGMGHIGVEHISGNLTDHYDPRAKVVRLSDAVYNQSSVAALGVAAHETGHALQDHLGYGPLRMRHAIYPITAISSKASMPIFMIGLFFGGSSGFLLQLGIILFSFSVIFQLVTLPVEFNASERALKILEKEQLLTQEEITPARKVLSAAALTYVAAAFASIMTLVRLLLIANRRND